ncbi:MAG: amidohydrolase [Candidatus Lokiarchaeota archaeon]|jgi:predicted amidohydrolase YtcJ
MKKETQTKKIYFGGPIITMDKRMSFVEAVGIEGELIIAVGSLKHVKRKLISNYQLIDLDSKVMIPGFCDCHLHPILKMFYLLSPDFSDITSISQFKERIRNASKNKSKNELIIGYNLSEEKFEKPILPTRWDLDEACPDKPFFVLRYDSHIGIANSKALELAGIDKFTIPPEGGEIRKNSKGDLNGIVSEKALDLIYSHMSLPSYEQMKNAFIQVSQIFAANGLTSVHGIVSGEPLLRDGDYGLTEFSIFESFKNYFLQNCCCFIELMDPVKLERFKISSFEDKGLYGKYKIGGLKLFLDGTLGAKTAYMHECFTDAPDMYGFCVVEEEEIYQQMKVAHNKGYQVIIHSIGDKGCRVATDLFIQLSKQYPRPDTRHRIEHASILTDDVIVDMEKYGIIASCQPPFLNSEFEWLEKRLGKERIRYTYPYKSIIDKGTILISGSDCPIEDSSPILGIHALVNRNNFVPEQCITMEEALKTYTINAAYASFQEKIKGSIEEGKLADLIILDKNPLAISKDQIASLKVLETIIRGTTIYKK